MSTPLLEAHEARVAVDDVVVVDRLSLVTSGDRVVLAGDASALLGAMTGVPSSAVGARPASRDDDGAPLGDAQVVAGTLLLAGKSVARAEHVAIMGAASFDPPFPEAWTAEDYVAWGGRLAGLTASAARELGVMALARTGLERSRRKAIGSLSRAERRALVLAQAVVAGPEVIVAEAPLAGLEGAAAAFVLQAFAAAIEGRRVLGSVARLDPGTAEGALVRTASHVVVLAAGEVAVEGPPSELFTGARIYTLAVRTNAEPLRAELAARGLDLRGGPGRYAVALPAGVGTGAILSAAQAARAAVVEMVPVIG